MKRINYNGGTFVTSDDIADALITYAADVGRAGGSVTVEVPTIEDDGAVGSHAILLNAASQLEAVPVDAPAGGEPTLKAPEFPPVDTRVNPVDDPESGATMPPIETPPQE